MSETKVKTSLPTQSSFNSLDDCKSLVEVFENRKFIEKVEAAVPKSAGVNSETMLSAFRLAAEKNPLIFNCDVRTTVGAFLSLSYLGLVPGTVMGQAHLIPFQRMKYNRQTRQYEPEGYDLNVIIGYPGYVELAQRGGFVTSVHADIVLPRDRFEFENGSRKFLHHAPNILVDQSKETPVAAYAFVKMKSEDDQFEVMPWHDILTIRERSQAYQTAVAAKEKAEKERWRVPRAFTDAPWVRDEREMAKKTAFRRLAKWLPKCPELRQAVAFEDMQEQSHDPERGGRGVDWDRVIDGHATPVTGVAEREETNPTDPGAVHTDRRQSKPPAEQTAAKAKPKPEAKPSESRKDTVGSFEQYLTDQFGDPVSDAPYTTAVSFAQALKRLWQKLGPDQEAVAALLEHNEEAIDAARAADPNAGTLLAELDEPPATEQQGQQGQQEEQATTTTSTAPMVVLEPIMERGKPQWGTWVNLLRDEITTTAPADLHAWVTVQRPVLERAPAGQRALAINVILKQFAAAQITSPDWLADLLTPSKAAGKPETDQATKDERWAEARMVDLYALGDDVEARRHFDIQTSAVAFKTVMARLERENPELHARVHAAYQTKHERLPPAPGQQT